MLFVSASESAAHLSNNERRREHRSYFSKRAPSERRVSAAHKNHERTKGLHIVKVEVMVLRFGEQAMLY